MTSKGKTYGWILLALVAWGVIFGIYEVVERTFLINSSPSTLHILHIIRGTATSFILAALVAWYIMRQGAIKPTAKDEVREYERYEISEEESIHRSLWLINLRWIAIIGVTLTTTTATIFFNALSRFSIIALGLIICVMILYNLAFLRAVRRTRTTKAVAFSQVLLDLISLTLMLHFSGGIENPFFTFFIFHVIIASILLQRKESYLIAIVTCVLFTSMVLLEYLDWLTHYPLGMGLGVSILTLPYVIGILSAFCATTFFSAYFATTIMSDLRKRQQQLKATSEQLAQEMKRIREMENELIQSSKMAAIGQLATGIAHEINNPLATISASTEFLQTYVNKDSRLSGLEPLTRHLQRIVDHVYRCKDIINNLLGFARKEEMSISSVNINKVLSETARIIEQSTPLTDKRLELKLADGLPHLPANEQQLQQVFTNLIHNALDAIPASGTISIKTYQKDGIGGLQDDMGSPQDGAVYAEVSDTGCGIAKDVLPRIFEPFFTTKPVGKGTGLGLYLCHQIISSLKGQITVDSKVGVGTTFRIYLPMKMKDTKRIIGIVLAGIMTIGLLGCSTADTKSQNPNPKSELGTLNSELETRIQSLIKQLDDNKPQIREQATNELINIGKPVEPYLQKTLTVVKGKNAEVEWRVKLILKVMPVRERLNFSDDLSKWYPNIYLDLIKGDASAKFHILQKITEMDNNRKPLHGVTEDDIAGVIGEVLMDGGKGLSSEQKQIICAICRGGSPRDTYYAVSKKWYKNVPKAAPYIAKFLKDDDVMTRLAAISALKELGAKEYVSDVTELLKDSDSGVRYNAVESLGKFGAGESIPAIRELLKDSDSGVRGQAVRALVALNATDAIVDIKKLLKDTDKYVRSCAISSLVKLSGKKAITDIKMMLTDDDIRVRADASIALAELGVKNSIPESVIEDIKSLVRKYQHEGDMQEYLYRLIFTLRQSGISNKEIEKTRKEAIR